MASKTRPSSFSDVLDRELDTIAVARDRGPVEGAHPRASSAHQRAADMQLRGLAFSGGGIRSATFNLGILQAFAGKPGEEGVLGHFDYLSTVSGGGYVGSWFSALIHHRHAKGHCARPDCVEGDLVPAGLKSAQSEASGEDPAVGFLRAYSNYLTPKMGLLSTDTLAAVAGYVRNLVLNQTELAALLVAILALPWLLHWLAFHWAPAASAALNPALAFAFVLLFVGILGLYINIRQEQRRPKTPHREPRTGEARAVLVPLAVVLVGATVLSWVLAREARFPPHWWMLAGAVLAYGLPSIGFLLRDVLGSPMSRRQKWVRGVWIVVSSLVTCGIGLAGIWAVHALFHTVGDTARGWLAIAVGPFVLLEIFSLTIVFHLGLLGRMLDYRVHEWWARFGAWAIAFGLFLAVPFLIAVYGPALVIFGGAWLTYLGGPAWLAASLWALIKGRSSTTTGSGRSWTEYLVAIGVYVFILGLMLILSWGLFRGLSLGQDQVPSPGAVTAAAATTAVANADAPGAVSPQANGQQGPVVCCSPVPAQAEPEWGEVARDALDRMDRVPAAPIVWALVAALAVWLVLAWRVDINLFSLQNFYRNRLTRCYLGGARIPTPGRSPDRLTGFDLDDDLPLADLADDCQRPYHILNTTLTITSGGSLAWQQRKGGSFFFSPHYCGFLLPRAADSEQHGGFIATRDYMQGIPRDGKGVRLGSVMATSGAAVSPNMGFHTSAGVAFLLTVFNVRLGRWCPNPAYAAPVRMTWLDILASRGEDPTSRLSPRVSGWLLLEELFGQAGSQSKYVYLSDGGHFDNLGIYELVRRRTALIVACDCGADPEMVFDDLADTIRKCYTDFGVRIEVAVEDLKQVKTAQGERFSTAHAVVGEVHYPKLTDDNGKTVPAMEGTLVLIKPTLSRELVAESPDVMNYALANQAFPQQTTLDQWFDEAQFESYRKLGYLTGRRVLEDEKIELKTRLAGSLQENL